MVPDGRAGSGAHPRGAVSHAVRLRWWTHSWRLSHLVDDQLGAGPRPMVPDVRGAVAGRGAIPGGRFAAPPSPEAPLTGGDTSNGRRLARGPEADGAGRLGALPAGGAIPLAFGRGPLPKHRASRRDELQATARPVEGIAAEVPDAMGRPPVRVPERVGRASRSGRLRRLGSSAHRLALGPTTDRQRAPVAARVRGPTGPPARHQSRQPRRRPRSRRDASSPSARHGAGRPSGRVPRLVPAGARISRAGGPVCRGIHEIQGTGAAAARSSFLDGRYPAPYPAPKLPRAHRRVDSARRRL